MISRDTSTVVVIVSYTIVSLLYIKALYLLIEKTFYCFCDAQHTEWEGEGEKERESWSSYEFTIVHVVQEKMP